VDEYDSYVICTSPRSGSTLLCNLLASSGVAGNPASYFHSPSISAWKREFDLVEEASCSERMLLDKIFKAALVRGSLDTGMFGLRMQQASFDFFHQKISVLHPGLSSDVQRIQAAFGRTAFIHLARRDKVAQAVSHVRAEQSGLWHIAPDGKELERKSPPTDPTYDPSAISARFDELKAYDRLWECWFAAEKLEPIRILYESLADRPTQTLSIVLDYLGLDCKAAEGVNPGVAKLADKTNEDWAAQFRVEGHCDKTP